MNPQPPSRVQYLNYPFILHRKKARDHTPRSSSQNPQEAKRIEEEEESKITAPMAKYVLLILAVGLLAVSCLLAVDAGVDLGSDLGWIPAAGSGGCDGSMGECGVDGEFEMDSEINRRILANQRYISYGALNKNSVPCSRRGSSYYNCRPGASANPYRRGCSRITRCRS